MSTSTEKAAALEKLNLLEQELTDAIQDLAMWRYVIGCRPDLRKVSWADA